MSDIRLRACAGLTARTHAVTIKAYVSSEALFVKTWPAARAITVSSQIAVL